MKDQELGKDCPRNTLDMISLKIFFLFVVYSPVLWWKLNCWSGLQFLIFFFLVRSPSQNSYLKYVKNIVSFKIHHRGFYHFSARSRKSMEFCIAKTVSRCLFFFLPMNLAEYWNCHWPSLLLSEDENFAVLVYTRKKLHTLAGRKPLHLSIASS